MYMMGPVQFHKLRVKLEAENKQSSIRIQISIQGQLISSKEQG